MKDACAKSNEKLDDFGDRLTELETKAAAFDKLQETVQLMQVDMDKTKHDLFLNEQRSRLNNVEIKGVPFKKDENLFSIMDAIGRKINYICPKTQINYISRVPIHNSSEKLIIVSFLNRYIKEDFVAAARLVKDLSDIQGGPRIYVNDHLSVDSKKLLTKTKLIAKERNYEFVWVKHGKIHVRKNNGCKSFIVRKEPDLNKII